MKKILVILPLLVLVFMFTTSFSKADICHVIFYVEVEFGEGNGYDYIGNEMTKCIKGECNTCRVVVIEKECDAVVNQLPVGGWSINTEITQLTFKSIGISPSQEFTSYDNTGFQFSSCFELKITECSAFPQLENIVIDLDGAIIDANQEITVYVPPMQ